MKKEGEKRQLRIVYWGTCVGFECETSENDSEIDIKLGPLILFLLNRNPFNIRAGFTETTNRVNSLSASEFLTQSDNPNFLGERCR